MDKPKLDRSKVGRKKGTPNKNTGMLKDAILKAAELCGEDGKGKGKIIGYCLYLARTEPKSFAGLLGRVLPLQLTGVDGDKLTVIIQSPDAKLL